MIMHKITAKDSILDSKPKKERKAHASLKIESIKFQQQSNKQASLSLSLSHEFKEEGEEEEEEPCWNGGVWESKRRGCYGERSSEDWSSP